MFTACGIMHRRCCLLVTSRQHRRCPKHVDLIEIINKIITVAPSLLFILLIRKTVRQKMPTVAFTIIKMEQKI